MKERLQGGEFVGMLFNQVGEPVEEARLAGVGTPGDDHRHALVQQPPDARALHDAREVVAHRLEALAKLAVGEKVDLLLGKVDGRLDIGAQLDDGLREPAHHGREFPLE